MNRPVGFVYAERPCRGGTGRVGRDIDALMAHHIVSTGTAPTRMGGAEFSPFMCTRVFSSKDLRGALQWAGGVIMASTATHETECIESLRRTTTMGMAGVPIVMRYVRRNEEYGSRIFPNLAEMVSWILDTTPALAAADAVLYWEPAATIEAAQKKLANMEPPVFHE